jgi:hypothetical protein
MSLVCCGRGWFGENSPGLLTFSGLCILLPIKIICIRLSFGYRDGSLSWRPADRCWRREIFGFGDFLFLLPLILFFSLPVMSSDSVRSVLLDRGHFLRL